jgi:DHA1 family tetracycline resistance protein-like MFS transporter
MEKFSWTSAQVGYSLGFVGLMVSIVQGGLIRITIPKLGYKNSVWVGLILLAIGLVLISLAGKGWMIYAFIVPYCLGGIAGPAIQGIISNQVPDNEQGEIQGAITGLMSLTSIIGPVIMTRLFSYFTKPDSIFIFPGAPFMLAALLVITSLIFSVRPLAAYHVVHGERKTT